MHHTGHTAICHLPLSVGTAGLRLSLLPLLLSLRLLP